MLIMQIRNDKIGVSPVIAVILMVAITVVLSGVLWAMLTNIDPTGPEQTRITMSRPVEKTYGWQIQISKVSGTLDLEDAKFQIIDREAILVYSITISNTNPEPFIDGGSKVYAMTLNPAPVNNGNATVGPNDALSVFEGCYIAYIDQTNDQKVNGGDSIYIYKDNNSDIIQDVRPNYIFQLMSGGEMAGSKTL